MTLHDDIMPDAIPDDEAYMLTERHTPAVGADHGEPPIYGMCTSCGAVEVELVYGAYGTRDLSYMGEHPKYPVGHGCEVCA